MTPGTESFANSEPVLPRLSLTESRPSLPSALNNRVGCWVGRSNPCFILSLLTIAPIHQPNLRSFAVGRGFGFDGGLGLLHRPEAAVVFAALGDPLDRRGSAPERDFLIGILGIGGEHRGSMASRDRAGDQVLLEQFEIVTNTMISPPQFHRGLPAEFGERGIVVEPPEAHQRGAQLLGDLGIRDELDGQAIRRPDLSCFRIAHRVKHRVANEASHSRGYCADASDRVLGLVSGH